jgi:hypothetical protein
MSEYSIAQFLQTDNIPFTQKCKSHKHVRHTFCENLSDGILPSRSGFTVRLTDTLFNQNKRLPVCHFSNNELIDKYINCIK